VYDTVSIEERNTPSVTLVNYGFVNDADSARRGKGMPGLRFLPTAVPCESSIMMDIEGAVDQIMDSIVAALTEPLTQEEAAPPQKTYETPERIIYQGDLEQINRFFYRNGWSDGFPIMPPTEKAVATMLTGTDLSPDLLLGHLVSRMGKATVEKIAVNAVMAGALPTHMPVLIAATRLLLESEDGFCGFCTFGFSTGSWAPFWIINGPIRNEINVNSGSGAFSPGNIANAAIGRAMGLIIKNIGGVRKGVEDMGVMGNPMKYTMVIAENEEDSPWKPLHVEYGFQPEDSTITVSYPNTYLQHWPYSADAEGILSAIMDNMPRGMRYTLILTPPHAKNLFREGYDKEKVRQYLVEHKLVPAARMKAQASTGTNTRTMEALKDLPENGAQLVPMIKDPRFIKIIVGGGPGAFIAQISGGGATPGKKQTQKIELPKNWTKLVAKYKNEVPTYAKYGN
jgi:hypothetical protein